MRSFLPLPVQQKITAHSIHIALFFLTACFFVSPMSVSLTTITYFSAIFFVLLCGDWRSRWHRIKNNKAALSFWLLFALYITGLFYSTSASSLMWKDLQKHHWLLITPLLIAVIHDERWRVRMIHSFLCAMSVTLLLSYIKYFTHASYFYHIPFTNPHLLQDASVFQNHIVQSFAMNIAAFICAYRAIFEKKYRLFYVILFLLMTINIVVMSMGRTGYGIYCLLLWYVGVVRYRWKGFFGAPVIAMTVLAIACLSSVQFRDRIQMIYEHTLHYQNIHHVTSVGQRIEMANIAQKMIAHRPWFGYGTGGIRTALPTIVPVNERVFNPSIDFVESIYADYALQFGVVGLVIFLIALGMQIKTSFSLPFVYRYLMQVVLIALLFGGLFNGFFVSFPFSHLYSLFSALCFSALSMSRCHD